MINLNKYEVGYEYISTNDSEFIGVYDADTEHEAIIEAKSDMRRDNIDYPNSKKVYWMANKIV